MRAWNQRNESAPRMFRRHKVSERMQMKFWLWWQEQHKCKVPAVAVTSASLITFALEYFHHFSRYEKVFLFCDRNEVWNGCERFFFHKFSVLMMIIKNFYGCLRREGGLRIMILSLRLLRDFLKVIQKWFEQFLLQKFDF